MRVLGKSGQDGVPRARSAGSASPDGSAPPRRSGRALAPRRMSVSDSPVRGQQIESVDPAARAAGAHRAGPGGVGGDHSAERGESGAGRVGRQSQAEAACLFGQVAQGNPGSGICAPRFGVYFDRAAIEGGQVHDDPPADIATRHPAPGASRNQRNPAVGGPQDQLPQRSRGRRNRDRGRQDTEDSGSLGIGRAGAEVGASDAVEIGKRGEPRGGRRCCALSGQHEGIIEPCRNCRNDRS